MERLCLLRSSSYFREDLVLVRASIPTSESLGGIHSFKRLLRILWTSFSRILERAVMTHYNVNGGGFSKAKKPQFGAQGSIMAWLGDYLGWCVGMKKHVARHATPPESDSGAKGRTRTCMQSGLD